MLSEGFCFNYFITIRDLGLGAGTLLLLFIIIIFA